MQVTIRILWRFFIIMGVLLLTLGLIGQWLRDINLIIGFFSYIPLLPIAVLGLLLDIVWRGRLVSYGRFLVSIVAIFAIFTHLHQLKGWTPFETVEKQAESIVLIHWNVLWGTWHHWEAIAQRIQAQSPDIIVISEPPSMWDLSQLKQQLTDKEKEWQLLSRWPLVLLSRYPIDFKEKIIFTNGFGVLVELIMTDKILRILMIDGKRDLWQKRDYLLGDIHHYLQQSTAENKPIHLVVGDFNALGNSRGFDAWSTLGYRLAGRTSGQWRGTWPSRFPLYDIDHVWLYSDLQLEKLQFLYHPATDHRGQQAQFSWKNAEN